MPLYTYTVADANGRLRTGEVEAFDQESAIAFLLHQGVTVVHVEEKKGKGRGSILQFDFFASLSADDLVLLTEHLATLLSAGVTIDEATEILLDDTEKPLLKRILTSARFNLEKGQPLSATFAQYPKDFPPVYISLLRAGEASGTLEKNLQELASQLKKENELRKKIKAAMVYPIILLVMSALVVTLMLTFVLPRLGRAFSQSGIELPLITRIMISISDVLTYNVYLTGGVALTLAVYIIWFRKTPAGKRFFRAALSLIPLGRKLLQKISLTRFSRTLGLLLRSGVEVLESLQRTSEAIGDHRFEQAIKEVGEQVNRGVSISNSLEKYPKLFPSLAVNMVHVGERTGTVDKVLQTLSEFYEEEVDGTLKSLVAIIEPLLLVLMGGVVGAIALAVILPIYKLSTAVG